MSYSALVTLRKLLAIAVAAGYFLSAGCRFACAETAAPSRMAGCHHRTPASGSHERQSPAPCCVTHSDEGAVALPSAVVLPNPARSVIAVVAAPSAVLLPQAIRVFGSDSSPPPLLSSAVLLASLSPRAPPFPPALL